MNHASFSILLLVTVIAFSCKKNSTSVQQANVQVGKTVTPGNISGPIQGTMQANQSYTVTGDVYIPAGDTVVIQPGAKITFTGAYNFWVQGNLFSLGSSSSPITFTFQGAVKEDVPSTPVSSDPAYVGMWGGIWCDTSCENLVIKWTVLDFGGAPISAAQPPIAGASTGDSYVIFFQNTYGNFIMEDSWLYGSTDDAVRIKSGNFSVMRNTFEKTGPGTGDCTNVKGGGVGDVAYNLYIGSSANSVKLSDKGQPGSIQTNVHVYNNTVVNGGYKNVELGRGGSINFEQEAEGVAYNNLIVNCRFGLRVIGATQSYLGNALIAADTAHITYGYTYNYADSAVTVNQFYPVTPDTSSTGNSGVVPVTGYWTRPQASDIPNILSIIPAGYYPGASYSNAAVNALAGQNNPMFKNFPLPESATPSSITYATGFDFHLQSGSPAIGKGYTGFQPVGSVPQGGNFGATITPPGADMGAYQSNGSGNQH